MSGFNNSKDTSKNAEVDKGKDSKQNQINRVSKKGKTLGAQHASHGDSANSGKQNQPKK